MSSDLEKLMAMVTTARADLASRSGSGMRPVKPPAGVSRWRILPGWNPDNRVKFYHEFGQHWIKSNGELLGTAVCDSVTFGHDCKYCRALGQEFSQMKAAGLTKDSAPWKAISEMNAGTTIVVNALCTDGPNKNLEQPVMLSLGKKVFEEFLSNLANALKEGDNILDLEAGSDISIEKTGSGFDTRYSLTVSRKSTAVDSSVLDRLVNIDEYIQSEVRRSSGSSPALITDAAKVALTGVSVAPRTMIPSKAARIIDAEPIASETRSIASDESSVFEKGTKGSDESIDDFLKGLEDI